MSKKTSRRRGAEEDDFISDQSWPFRKRLRFPREIRCSLIQLCAAFNILALETAAIFHIEAVRCIVARNGESKCKSRFNAQCLERAQWRLLIRHCDPSLE